MSEFSTKSRIIVDETHTAAGKTLQEMCDFLETEIGIYKSILNQVTTDAAKEGLTTTRYQEYAGIISGLKGQLSRLGTMLNSAANSFISDIDAADSYLY